MAKGKKSNGSGVENDDRHCKKAWKKRKGVAPGAHNGKTVDGYTPERIEARALIRAKAAARNARQAA